MYRPELVDLKVTDMCLRECPYCYQSSSREGREAFLSKISKIADILQSLQVFEVAIGGGEPMTHSKIFDIATTFKKRNIAPNLSTRAWEVFKYRPIANKIKSSFSSIGLSVDSPAELMRIQKEGVSLYYFDLIHYVLGIGNVEDDLLDFRNIMEGRWGPGLLLLEPKGVGRGADFEFKSIDYERLARLLGVINIKVSIDTELAKNLEPYIEDVDNRLYRTEDGIHSKYIDAVEMVVGPSSYVEKSRMYKFSKNKYGIDTEKLKRLLVREDL